MQFFFLRGKFAFWSFQFYWRFTAGLILHKDVHVMHTWPSSKIFYWPFQGGTSFVDLLCFCSVLCLLCFVRVCLYVLCGHLLGKGWPLGSRLWCLLWVCHFPIGILGQVWYLIVSIPDLCNLITFLLYDITQHDNNNGGMWVNCQLASHFSINRVDEDLFWAKVQTFNWNLLSFEFITRT